MKSMSILRTAATTASASWCASGTGPATVSGKRPAGTPFVDGGCGYGAIWEWHGGPLIDITGEEPMERLD